MYIEKIVNNDIRLDQFLKWIGVADTGGMAKLLIQNGEISVNGNVEIQRGKKLSDGDLVQVSDNVIYQVVVKK